MLLFLETLLKNLIAINIEYEKQQELKNVSVPFNLVSLIKYALFFVYYTFVHRMIMNPNIIEINTV